MSRIRFLFLIWFAPLTCFSQTAPDSVSIIQLLEKGRNLKYVYPDSALFYANEAEKACVKPEHDKFLSKAYQLRGDYFNIKENYGKSTENFLNALKIEERLNNPDRIALLNDRLGIVWSKLEKFPKALGYYEKALKIYLRLKDSLYIAMSYSHIGTLHSSREYCETRTVPQKRVDYNTAISYYEKSVALLKKLDAQTELLRDYLNLASVYNKFQMPEKALGYSLKAMDYYIREKDSSNISQTNYVLGMTYRRLKQYDKSINCFKECIDFETRRKTTEGIQFVYEQLAQTYEDAGDFRNSLYNYKTYMIIRDSTYNNEKSKQIFELETKYQTEKKEKEILSLTVEKQRKQRSVHILIGVLVIIGLTGTYFISRARARTVIAEQNNKINEQKIKEMEKERQLVAAHAVLQGEETERSRLARDLHDGLGGLLSGLKLSLNNIKGNIFLSEDNVGHFNKSLGLLDVSIKELRRVAHNMMPEALSKFGLMEALTDFCSGLNSPGTEVKFQHHGINKRIDQKLEISIYRIVQELVNNALKHAEAPEILLLIVQEENRIHITVQDNGKGFDPEILKTSKGAGFPNIRSRVESLNGMLEVYSKPDKGTEVSVEFWLTSTTKI